MTLTPRTVWRIGAGAVIFICLLALTMCGGARNTTTDPGTTATTAVAPTTATPIDAEHPEDEGIDVPPELADQARRFLTSYYLVNPNDDRTSRKERVAEYVAPAFISKLPLSLSISSKDDQVRRQLNLSLRGEVVMDRMSGSAGPSSNAIIVTVPIILTVSSPDGRSVSAERYETVTAWSNKRTAKNNQGAWLLQKIE